MHVLKCLAYRQDTNKDISTHVSKIERGRGLGVVAHHKVSEKTIRQTNSRVYDKLDEQVRHVVSGGRVQLRPRLLTEELPMKHKKERDSWKNCSGSYISIAIIYASFRKYQAVSEYREW